ncbi:hypothetical protein M3P05_09905 [Sansalvadorimonas sp. 2012CJ34-2]|uniref:Outer membrane lipoprotein SlyB n=1 Tax=Parendozoicomonas callyspongiae TaxID=2942213 RepID=A0ABT0PFT5_9GAMM|nr:hypothetical protein [Sansalvadorimonas sp. 2012CJ34-2]MCL6270239.1 hypothetical protein [Sansalvadorimonas sp. 2012CJ34-2]
MKKTAAILMSVILLGVTGCAQNLSSNVYSTSEARKMQTIQEGRVVELAAVQIEGSKGGLGAIAGGAAGGIAAGANIGGGSGSNIAAIGGALLGGMLGNMAEESLTRQPGVNITVRLNSGELASVIQPADQNMIFQVGDPVRIYTQGGTSRVVKQ